MTLEEAQQMALDLKTKRAAVTVEVLEDVVYGHYVHATFSVDFFTPEQYDPNAHYEVIPREDLPK